MFHAWIQIIRAQMDAVGVSFWQVVASLLTFVGWLVVSRRLIRLARLRPKSQHEALRTDIAYWCLGPLIALFNAAVVACALTLIAAAVGGFESTTLQGFGPVMRQPHWAVMIEMFVAADLLAYWSHRLCHHVPFLWRLHAVHHSSQHVSWLSAARAHPLNQAFTQLFNTLPLFCLGFPVSALLTYTPLVAAYAIFIHANVNISLRPIAFVATSPVYHRFHHTHVREGGDRNFAGLFPIFDVMFGTYYFPKTAPGALGLDDGALPERLWGQLTAPFRGPRPQTVEREPGRPLVPHVG